jgi:hypothetical protein
MAPSSPAAMNSAPVLWLWMYSSRARSTPRPDRREVERLAADQPVACRRRRQVVDQVLGGVALQREPLAGLGDQP